MLWHNRHTNVLDLIHVILQLFALEAQTDFSILNYVLISILIKHEWLH